MFGQMLRNWRHRAGMTLRQLGERTGMDYIVLNKIELGLRMPPPLEGIMALADTLELTAEEFEQLLDEAARGTDRAGARFTADEVRRIKESQTAAAFFTRRENNERKP